MMIKLKWNNPYLVPIIWLAGFLLRLAWILTFDPEVVSDATWYIPKAIDMANGYGYVRDQLPTAFYPVGYVAVLAAWIKLFGTSLVGLRLLNLLFYSIAFYFFYRLMRQLKASEITVVLSLVLFALYPNHIAYVNLIYNEYLYLAVFLGLIYSLSCLYKDGNWKWLLISGLFSAMACYIKPQALFIPAIMALLFYRRQVQLKRYVSQLVFIYGLIFLFTLPWQLRNYKAFGEWKFITSVKGYDLLIGNNPTARGNYYFDDAYWKQFNWDGKEAAYEARVKKAAIRYMRENPIEVAKRLPNKLYYFFWPGMDGISWNMEGMDGRKYTFLKVLRFLGNVDFLVFVIIYLIICFGSLFFPKIRQQEIFRLNAFLLAYHLFLSLVFFGESRFHFHLIPIWIWVFSEVITRFWNQEVQNNKKPEAST